MRFLLPQNELLELLPTEPGKAAHCRRVAALALEIGNAVSPRVASPAILEQAALLHHASPIALDRAALGRLSAEVLPHLRPSSATTRTKRFPEGLDAVLAAFQGFPPTAEDQHTRLMAEILTVSNWLDEQIESLQFEPKPMAQVWEELRDLNGLVQSSVLEAVRQALRGWRYTVDTGRLPAQIAEVKAVLGLLTERSAPDIAALTAFAGRDPVIASSFLRAANCALYAKRHEIRTIRQAIAYIGGERSRQLLLALTIRPLLVSSKLKDLWRHSVWVAQVTEAIARDRGFLDPDEALLAGLVHDIGRIAALTVPPAIAAVYARLQERGCPHTYTEQLLLGMDHGEIGAGILLLFGFPDHLVEGVRFHHRPAVSDSVLASALYAADFWAEADEDIPSACHLHTALSRIGCSWEHLAGFRTANNALSALLATA